MELSRFYSAEAMFTTAARPTVGLLSADVPRELLYALGCTPVRVFPTARKPAAAEDFLPRNFCALTRLILASFLDDGEPGLDTVPDSVIFTDEDDATRRLHDIWRAHVPVPIWGFIEVPRAATPLAARRYADILASLATDTSRRMCSVRGTFGTLSAGPSPGLSAGLEARAGQSLTAGALRQAITLYNEQRSLVADLKRRWLAGRVNTATYRRLRRMALTRHPVAANEQLAQALTGAGEQAGEGGPTGGVCPPTPVHPRAAPLAPESSAAPRSHRLLLLAELAAPAGLVRLVEAHGARVVAEDSDLDERDLQEPVPADAETVDGLLLALANAYLSRPPGPRMRDLPRRLDYLSQLVSTRGVGAAICAYGKFCDPYLAEFPILRAHLRGLGVPVLLLELEDEAISGQHRTRVEAFLEMTGSQ